MEKAQKVAVVAFLKSNKFKNCLDFHYAADYEDFLSNAKEAYPEMDFDSFKIPTAIESSLLPTSSEDVNVMEDASTEPTQGTIDARKDDPKLGVMPLVVYPSNLFSFLEKFIYFSLFGSAVVLGFNN